MNSKVDIHVDMGDGPATPSAGYAGWEEVPRVEQRAMTTFVGSPAFQQDVPIMLDGYRENRSVERQLEAVLSLGGNTIFKAFGPIFNEGQRFIFGDEPDFGEMIRSEDGTLIRARLTLKLKGYVPADVAGKRKEPHVAVADAVPLSFTVRKDVDTLVKVAFAVYHDKNRWHEIGRKNGISDPYKRLQPGRELTL